MNQTASDRDSRRIAFDRLLGELRPKLHRYCARMTGSVIDGEDVVQEALVKAIEGFAGANAIENLEGWLFRIAHNTALDFLRRRVRQMQNHSDEDLELMTDPATVIQDREIAAASLRTFMRLAPVQRSSVILMDVLGHSLEEISGVTRTSIPAVKAALHRGRARLHELGIAPDDAPQPVLSERERTLLAVYVERFNARDVGAMRAMLAEEVRLDLVARHHVAGRSEVSKYFGNYDKIQDWRLLPGMVEGGAAALVCDPGDPAARPTYFVLLKWDADRLIGIRDFRYARYAIEAADYVVL